MSKFLSYEDRLIITQRVQENASFGAIGKELGKDRTTIAKEIKKYSYDKKSGRPGYPYNPCKFRATCKTKKLCGTRCTHQSAYKCSLCSECTLHCSDFAEEICSVKTKPPYVCNGCGKLPKCTLLKRIYDPADAHEKAYQSISEARTDILSNEDDIARINQIISPLVRNGQSLHQIYLDHVDEIMCSEKTLYNYVDAQLFDVRNIDLPRKVKYRPRYKTNVFYCDPSAPYQKGACEVNHELIHRILPKGSSFDDLTQKDIFLMMDHINSYKRKKLNNRSPYEAFSFYYGEDVLRKLGCRPVAAENIILKSKLLKK